MTRHALVFALMLLLTGSQAARVHAQDTSPTTEPPPAGQPVADAAEKPAAPTAGATLRGLVLRPDGVRNGAAVVRLIRTSSAAGNTTPTDGHSGEATGETDQPRVRTTLAEPNGAYAFTDIPPGSYTLRATTIDDTQLAASTSSFELKAGDTLDRDLMLRSQSELAAERWLTAAGTVAVLAAYLLILLFFRFYNIIAPARALLGAQLQSVSSRLDIEADQSQHASQIAKLKDDLAAIATELGTVTWGSTLFWSRGEELAAWARVHEVERQLATFLMPLSRTVERAELALAELSTNQDAEARVLAERMRGSLQTLGTLLADPAADPLAVEAANAQVKHQLAEALAIVYEDRDTQFAALMEWQNKAMWLTSLSLGIIAGIVFMLDHAWLLLVGAAGGLMSRLARTLLRQDVPSDYGASWTTLFLSPLLGAIGAWFGVLMIVALVGLGVFGEALAAISWPPQQDALTMALAFLLGFSERLFTTLLSTMEGRLDAQTSGSSTGAAGSSAPHAPATAPAPSPVAGILAQTPAADATHTRAADRLVAELDLTPGEQVALVGDAASPTHRTLQALVGAANVHVVDAGQLNTVAPLDGIVLERLPPIAELRRVAAQIQQALAPRGRAVVVGSTAAGLFDASAEALTARGEPGPALVHDAMTKEGLLAQEPPDRLDGTDPVRWIASYENASVSV